VCGEGIENIDPMAFDDPVSRKHLLYWGSGGHPIRVRELAVDRLHFSPEPATPILFADEQQAYGSLVEGAWLVFREGLYYLFYSGDHCCRAAPRYAVMVARSESPFGPFEKLSAPILEESAAWIAPGHCSVIRDDAGTDWLLYHAMESARFGPDGARLEPFVPRLMLLDRLVYRDGWPSVAGKAPSSGPMPGPAIVPP
jgi:arabinan endo-1,5-alpha-L-arabinosidase